MIIYLKNYLSYSNLYKNIISHEIKLSLSNLHIFNYIIYIHVSDKYCKKYINNKINYYSIYKYFIKYDKFDIIYKI